MQMCSLKIKTKREKLEDFKMDDFEIVDYKYHKRIPAKMVV